MYRICMNTVIWRNGVRYTDFSVLCECNTEAEAKSELVFYQQIYCGYPVEIWIESKEVESSE